MTLLSIRVPLLAGIAAIAISVPATASPTVSGDTHARPAQGPYVQYAQYDPKDRAKGIIGLGYKSKKAKTSKKKTGTTGQGKSNQ